MFRWGPGLTRLLAKRDPAEIVCVKRSNFRREPFAEIVGVERSNVRRNANSGCAVDELHTCCGDCACRALKREAKCAFWVG